MKVVIPAAGLGSRMLPLTKVIPKEMLPAGRKPFIHHIVEEAVASGIREICIVIREGKEVIKDYFLLRQPEARKRGRNIEELEELVARCELTFVYQRKQQGLGDALLQAKDFIGRDSFVMMIPDQLSHAATPATRQLLRHLTRDAVCSSLVRLPKEEVKFFPGARGFEFEREGASETLRMGRLLSEEEIREAYRDVDYEIRGFGRTIYPSEIFDCVGREPVNPQTGELDFAKAFESLTAKLPHRGVLLAGEFYDVGTFESYYHYQPQIWSDGY